MHGKDLYEDVWTWHDLQKVFGKLREELLAHYIREFYRAYEPTGVAGPKTEAKRTDRICRASRNLRFFVAEIDDMEKSVIAEMNLAVELKEKSL